jgi:hypothetical protein
MKHLIVLLLPILVAAKTATGQITIKFKGKNKEIAGKSCGSIPGLKNNPSYYEDYWEIDNSSKTLTVTTVQTFGTAMNNKDIKVSIAPLIDIDKSKLFDSPLTDTNSFGIPVYEINLLTKDLRETISSSTCYRFSQDDSVEPIGSSWNLRLTFANKTEAASFIKKLKASIP